MPHDDGSAEPSAAQQALVETFALDGRLVRFAASAGVVVADGRGVKISVDRGHLVVADGLGRHRRERRFPRAERSIRRLVVLGRSGFLTLEAVRWCEAVGIAVVVLDQGEAVLASAHPRVDDSRLRRAQAMAWGSPVGLAVAVDLLGRKVTAHADTCYLLPTPRPDVSSTLLALADTLSGAMTVDEARQLEAVAAAAYFEAWSEVVIRFADECHLPHHWQRFDGRRSPLMMGSGNRKATTPINALLNYLYTLAGTEARLAAVALGLDPGLGVVHADKKARASMALDLVEPVRPHVEGYVLRLVAERTFRRLDFAEQPDGTVRVNSPLTHELAATMPAWAAAVAPMAERVAHTLAAAASGRVIRSTPLTQANHRHRQGKPEAPARLPGIVATCKRCGGVLRTGQGTYCTPCWPKVRLDLQREASAAAVAARRKRAAAGQVDLAHTPASEGRRLASLRASLDARTAAQGGGWSAESFDAVILPALAAVELGTITAALGVSRSAASRWRSGQLRPAPAKWAALASMSGVELPIQESKYHA